MLDGEVAWLGKLPMMMYWSPKNWKQNALQTIKESIYEGSHLRSPPRLLNCANLYAMLLATLAGCCALSTVPTSKEITCLQWGESHCASYRSEIMICCSMPVRLRSNPKVMWTHFRQLSAWPFKNWPVDLQVLLGKARKGFTLIIHRGQWLPQWHH